jgi:hypothetical protein
LGLGAGGRDGTTSAVIKKKKKKKMMMSGGRARNLDGGPKDPSAR